MPLPRAHSIKLGKGEIYGGPGFPYQIARTPCSTGEISGTGRGLEKEESPLDVLFSKGTPISSNMHIVQLLVRSWCSGKDSSLRRPYRGSNAGDLISTMAQGGPTRAFMYVFMYVCWLCLCMCVCMFRLLCMFLVFLASLWN